MVGAVPAVAGVFALPATSVTEIETEREPSFPEGTFQGYVQINGFAVAVIGALTMGGTVVIDIVGIAPKPLISVKTAVISTLSASRTMLSG